MLEESAATPDSRIPAQLLNPTFSVRGNGTMHEAGAATVNSFDADGIKGTATKHLGTRSTARDEGLQPVTFRLLQPRTLQITSLLPGAIFP